MKAVDIVIALAVMAASVTAPAQADKPEAVMQTAAGAEKAEYIQ